MANANSIANIAVLPGALSRSKTPPRWKGRVEPILVTIFGILVTSGVCFMTFGLSHPIFASEGNLNLKSIEVQKQQQEELRKEELQKWEASLIKKYPKNAIYRPSEGVAHIRTTKYINGLPVKINIVEINPKVNPNLIIKPQLAGEKLNSRATIRTIANKNGAIIALNAGYFKPQTGVPLGSLMVDNKTITGPIYNRVGIGIAQNENGTSFSMGRIDLDIEIKNKFTSIKVDNINQPRMLSTYSLIYTKEWGKMSPPPPKYGAIAVVEDGAVVNISQSAVEIPENGFVLSAPANIVNKLFAQKKLELAINYPEEFTNANHIAGGGPYLIKEGQIYIDIKEQKLNAIGGKNPRSAIGYTQEGVLILIAADGREESSVGMTLGQLADYMKGLGCYNAMNFDGGGSSVMYVNGKIANSPPTREGIAISNALTISIKG